MDYMDEVLIFAASKILEFPWSLPIRPLNRLELYPGNEAFNVSLLLVVDLSLYFQTPVKDEKTGETKDKVTAFIVERGFGGVTRYYLKVTLPSFQVFSFLIVDTTNFEIRLFDVTRGRSEKTQFSEQQSKLWPSGSNKNFGYSTTKLLEDSKKKPLWPE